MKCASSMLNKSQLLLQKYASNQCMKAPSVSTPPSWNLYPTSTHTKGCSNCVLRLRSQFFYFRSSPALSTVHRIHPTLYSDNQCPYQPLPVQLSSHCSSPPLLGTCAFLVLTKFSKLGGFSSLSVPLSYWIYSSDPSRTFRVAYSNLKS